MGPYSRLRIRTPPVRANIERRYIAGGPRLGLPADASRTAPFGVQRAGHKHLLVVARSIAENVFWRLYAINDRLCDRSGFSSHCG
jgi:hypothetical protein